MSLTKGQKIGIGLFGLALGGLAVYFVTRPRYLKGDVLGDGVVNEDDVTAAERIALGLTTMPDGRPLTPEMAERADINGNGQVDPADITAIENIIAEQTG